MLAVAVSLCRAEGHLCFLHPWADTLLWGGEQGSGGLPPGLRAMLAGFKTAQPPGVPPPASLLSKL